MKRQERQFTETQKAALKQSCCVKEVHNNHIVYTNEFKLKAVKEYKEGKTPLEIFTNSDLPLDCITRKNAFNLIKKWLKQESRLKNNAFSGNNEKMELLARIAYLEAENEYLKKLK